MRLGPFLALAFLGLVVASACGDEDASSSFSDAGNSAAGEPGASGGEAPGAGGTTSSGGSSSASGGSTVEGGTDGAGGTASSAGGEPEPMGGGGASPEVGGAPGAGGTPDAGGAPDVGGMAGAAGAAPMCTPFQGLCEDDAACCSGICNEADGFCESAIVECRDNGEACEAPTDCCDLSCIEGECADAPCVSDGGECTEGAECCGGTCGEEGSCVPLNESCKTAGNECGSDAECCSTGCIEGVCDLDVSWCIQPGDVCSRSEDCCSGDCQIAEGRELGTCLQPPDGSSFCHGVDGTVCNGCGDCCSRLCAPHGQHGRNICQPANGCHVTGDLCRQDTDCCGGDEDAPLPGAGNVYCQIDEGRTLGICRNPMSCSPQGNVCHFKNYACDISSARANCCGGLGANGGVCQLDGLGVPRCNGLDECLPAGDQCASTDDCCDDVPCVPDEEGVLRCADIPDGDPKCIQLGLFCTISADCCSGTTCVRVPGSLIGTCRTPEVPGEGGAGGGGPEGGAPGAGGTTGEGGTSSGGTGGEPDVPCAEYGQFCDGASDCCNDVPCNAGACRYNTP